MRMMIEEEVEENVSILNCCSRVLFFMKEKIDFSQPRMDERNEKEKRKKQKQSREEKKEKKKRSFFIHISKNHGIKTTEREDDFYDDIDDQNGFNTTTKIFVFSFLFLPKL